MFLSVLTLELGCFVVLGFIEEDPGETSRSPSAWLVNAQQAFERGFYQPDRHALWTAAPGFREPITSEGFWGDAPLELNEHGHRNGPMSRRKPPGIKRALLLGGSHPFGMWVRTDQSYAAVLQRALGPGWQVINAACPGHTSFQGREVLEHHGLAFEPDLVLFDLGVNDELPLGVDFARPDHEVAAVPWWLTRVRTGLGRTSTYLVLRQIIARAEPTMEGVRVPPAARAQNVREVTSLASGIGARVLLFSQMVAEPRGIQCTETYEGQGVVFDACGVFAPFGAGARDYFVDPIHATADGHRLLGEALHARLAELGWLSD